ncbi:hypothetical protein LXL04_017445 [Taraxacum kok-saghyz]
MDLWRNGSASDSRSEGCVFDSRQKLNKNYQMLQIQVVEASGMHSTINVQMAPEASGQALKNLNFMMGIPENTGLQIHAFISLATFIESIRILTYLQNDLWRNGSAYDTRSEGCVFDSRQSRDMAPEVSIGNLVKGAFGQTFKNLNLIIGILENTGFSKKDLWRNGSASDSRSEGCVFDSRQSRGMQSAINVEMDAGVLVKVLSI